MAKQYWLAGISFLALIFAWSSTLMRTPDNTPVVSSETRSYNRSSSKYNGPSEEREMSYVLDDFGVQYAKMHGMKFQCVGDFSDNDHILYGLLFKNAHKMTLEEGRILAANLMEEYLKLLKSHPSIKKYHDYCNRAYRNFADPPFLSDEIGHLKTVGIRIGYWDENIERPQKPYLAQIAFFREHFHYYEAHPETQALVLVLKESCSDAIRFRDSQR